MNILVVDDTADCREPLARFLRVAGYNTTTAASGPEALDRLQEQRPDLILLDLMMPVMDGVSFLKILRDNENWKDLPVVLVTALSDGGALQEAARLGATHSLLKARYTAHDLLTCIDQICQSNGSA